MLESRTSRDLWDGPPGVFISWSYIAKDIIPVFQRHGWKTVVMQLDGAEVEEDIVADEVARYPGLEPNWRRAPAGYFADWREECARADQLIANSPWGVECLRRAGVAAEKVTYIPFAADPRHALGAARSYPPAFSPQRAMRVLFLGQMIVRKGLAQLFEAIRLLREVPVEFHFAGSVGVEFPADLLRDPRVKLHGRVSREEVERLYRESDMFVLPTLSDGFGLTQLEAMHWRLPLVASRRCGEVVVDGRNGVLLEDVSGPTIAGVLRELCAHPERLAAMSGNCAVPRHCCLEHFGAELLKLEARLWGEHSNG